MKAIISAAFAMICSALVLVLMSGCITVDEGQPATAKDNRAMMAAQDSACKSGEVVEGFLAPRTANGFPCAKANRTCVRGTWQGPEIYETCSEEKPQ